jgi:hypothetical protein
MGGKVNAAVGSAVGTAKTKISQSMSQQNLAEGQQQVRMHTLSKRNRRIELFLYSYSSALLLSYPPTLLLSSGATFTN